MRVGILGSGLMGGKLGTIFVRAGHKVVFSYARSEQKLKRLAREAKGNARAGTPREVMQEADALLLAVHWLRMDDVLSQAGDLSGKVIITCSLPMDAGNTGLVIGQTASGAEELAKKLPKARAETVISPHHEIQGDSNERSTSELHRRERPIQAGSTSVFDRQCGIRRRAMAGGCCRPRADRGNRRPSRRGGLDRIRGSHRVLDHARAADDGVPAPA